MRKIIGIMGPILLLSQPAWAGPHTTMTIDLPNGGVVFKAKDHDGVDDEIGRKIFESVCNGKPECDIPLDNNWLRGKDNNWLSPVGLNDQQRDWVIEVTAHIVCNGDGVYNDQRTYKGEYSGIYPQHIRLTCN